MNIPLKKNQIKWLLENYQNSNHVLNRLLRYPKTNKAISEWAETQYKKKLISKRNSELLGILIDSNIPDFVNITDKKTLLWGIIIRRLKKRLFQVVSVVNVILLTNRR